MHQGCIEHLLHSRPLAKCTSIIYDLWYVDLSSPLHRKEDQGTQKLFTWVQGAGVGTSGAAEFSSVSTLQWQSFKNASRSHLCWGQIKKTSSSNHNVLAFWWVSTIVKKPLMREYPEFSYSTPTISHSFRNKPGGDAPQESKRRKKKPGELYWILKLKPVLLN